jgi:hypothetical protein
MIAKKLLLWVSLAALVPFRATASDWERAPRHRQIEPGAGHRPRRGRHGRSFGNSRT